MSGNRTEESDGAKQGTDSRRSLATDGIGIAVFAVAAFAGASVIMSWLQPVDEPSGSAALVTGLVAFLGELPILGLCAATAWLGSRLFLGGPPERLGRIALTVLLACLGLSVVLGGAWAPHGGRLGETAAALLTPLAASLFGLAVIGVPIWHLWLRPDVPASAGEVEPRPAPAPDVREGGLSAAEADALLPRAAVPSHLRRSPPSVYPPDVRLQGQIPEGARAIPAADTNAHAPRTDRRADSPGDEPLPSWASPSWAAAEQPARADLASGADESADAGWSTRRVPERAGRRTADLPAEGLTEPEPARTPTPEIAPAPQASSADRATPVDPRDSAETDDTGDGMDTGGIGLADADPVVEAADEAGLPKPSWEQPGLFEGEEPVDAYGTPLSLVASLRGEGPETAEPADAVAELTDAESPESPESPGEEVDELDEEVVAAEDAEEYEEEEDEDAEEDAEEEYAEEDSEEYAEEDEGEGEDEDDAEYAEEEEYEEEYEEEVAAEDDSDDAQADAADSEEEESVAAEAPAGAEPQVELVPHRASSGRSSRGKGRSAKTPETVRPVAADEDDAPDASDASDDSDADLVFRAGALILDRGRVAVSLLQREFRLDFDQATAVLDQLQEQGLIGPYVGGQRRDILLSPEEWQEKRVATG